MFEVLSSSTMGLASLTLLKNITNLGIFWHISHTSLEFVTLNKN
jgi:hypothetical protein